MIISITLTAIIVVLLMYRYKNREEIESNLGFKIVGYYLLGAFTFRINELALPLGFMIFLLFFRPTRNVQLKQFSAMLGLIMYFAQLIIPAVDEYWFERPHEVAGMSNHASQLRFSDDWGNIRSEMNIEPHARLENFKMEYHPNGQITRLTYDLISSTENGFIQYDVAFSSETKEYTIRRQNVGERWLQYDRLVFASRFFEVLDEIKVRNVSIAPLFERNILISDGELASYAIEDRRTYVIRGNEWQEVTNHDLPIEGYVITSCAKGETDAMSSGCENIVEYLFDARKN